MDALPRVAVIGAGAVGGFFGGMLARAGAVVTMIGRPGRPSPHMQAIARDGVFIDGIKIREAIAVGTSNRVEDVAAVDLVLFSVKTMDTESAARALAPHLADGTIVVSLQNGIDNVDRMRTVGVDAIAAVVFVAAAVEAPGRIKHRGRGDLVIGHTTRGEDLRRVSHWFERAGVPCPVSDDVERELWLKLVINSMANATSALTGASYQRLAEFEPTWNLAVAIAKEAVAVAARVGVLMELETVLEKGRAVMISVGAATSSTEQDIANGRTTEIDSLNGYISRKGAEVDIPTPTNDALRALVKLREQRAGQPTRVDNS